MATTADNLQLSLAYRLHEDSAPSGTEASRRLQSLNEAYFTVLRKNPWWFTEAKSTFNSVADQESYTSTDGFPSDLRGSSILELRYNDTLYTPILQSEAFSEYTGTYYTGHTQSYFVFNKSLYPVPKFPAAGTNNVTIKYYKYPTKLVSGSDTVLIPDEYADILVSFALARKYQAKGKRGSASDAFDEFNEVLAQMNKEQNDYMFALKSTNQQFVGEYE